MACSRCSPSLSPDWNHRSFVLEPATSSASMWGHIQFKCTNYNFTTRCCVHSSRLWVKRLLPDKRATKEVLLFCLPDKQPSSLDQPDLDCPPKTSADSASVSPAEAPGSDSQARNKEFNGINSRVSSANSDGDGSGVLLPKSSTTEPEMHESMSSIVAATAASKLKKGEQPGQEQAFEVPWTLLRAFVMTLIWAVVYALLTFGSSFVLEVWTGFPVYDLSTVGRAIYHFVLDCFIAALTVAMLFFGLRKHMPLARNLFKFHLSPWRSWLPVLLCCISFPILHWMSLRSQSWFPELDEEDDMDLEEVLAAGDLVTRGLWFGLLNILAPVWEELMFRGFVLPSLSKFLPVPGAVIVSSVIFAMAHWSLQKSPGLVLIGVMLGTVYCRSKNLLHPIVLHALWNLSIFCQLLYGGGYL